MIRFAPVYPKSSSISVTRRRDRETEIQERDGPNCAKCNFVRGVNPKTDSARFFDPQSDLTYRVYRNLSRASAIE